LGIGTAPTCARRRKSRGVSPTQRWKARVKCAGWAYLSVRATSLILRPDRSASV